MLQPCLGYRKMETLVCTLLRLMPLKSGLVHVSPTYKCHKHNHQAGNQARGVKSLERWTSSWRLWIEVPLSSNIQSSEMSMSKLLIPYRLLSCSVCRLHVLLFKASSFFSFQVHVFSWSLKKKEWLVKEGIEVWPFHESSRVDSSSSALLHIYVAGAYVVSNREVANHKVACVFLSRSQTTISMNLWFYWGNSHETIWVLLEVITASTKCPSISNWSRVNPP